MSDFISTFDFNDVALSPGSHHLFILRPDNTDLQYELRTLNFTFRGTSDVDPPAVVTVLSVTDPVLDDTLLTVNTLSGKDLAGVEELSAIYSWSEGDGDPDPVSGLETIETFYVTQKGGVLRRKWPKGSGPVGNSTSRIGIDVEVSNYVSIAGNLTWKIGV